MHDVFMGTHFEGYNHLVGLTYLAPDGEERWLPLVGEDGLVDGLNFDRLWLRWTFRTVGADIDQERLEQGIERFTAYWAAKNGVSLADAEFRVKVKYLDDSGSWRSDFLSNQLAHPWLDGGAVKWTDEEYRPELRLIEELTGDSPPA
jgi:hypothetical protein